MSEDDKAFYSGFAVVLGCLIRERDLPSVAVDIMRSNGVELKHLIKAGVDNFDLKPIRRAWKQEA